MASKFQSRLIGTVILVAIGVIVLPDIFDGKKEHYQEEFAAIPIKPSDELAEPPVEEIKPPVELDVPLPEEPVATVTVESEQQEVKVEEESKQEKPTVKEVAKTEPEQVKEQQQEAVPAREKNQYADSAWIIQLAALKNRENAEKIVADLQQRGFQAHLKQDGTINRVIVGPDVSKQKLEQQVEQLQKITGLKGQIRTFKPLN